MPSDILVSAPEGGVVLVSLNRPAKRNALSIALRDEVTDALGTIADDDAVKVVILSGAGEDARLTPCPKLVEGQRG